MNTAAVSKRIVTATINGDSVEFKLFLDAVTEVASELAQALVRDGEGATKFITIHVEGGMNETECRKVGYAIAPPPLTAAIRKVHDFLTVGAAAPLQEAGVTALRLPPSYYDDLATLYQAKRDRFLPALEDVGFQVYWPQGAYYAMADLSSFGSEDDRTFALRLIQEAGVAVVPGSSFFSRPELGRHLVRFCFCKKDETLDEAIERLQRWAQV